MAGITPCQAEVGDRLRVRVDDVDAQLNLVCSVGSATIETEGLARA